MSGRRNSFVQCRSTVDTGLGGPRLCCLLKRGHPEFHSAPIPEGGTARWDRKKRCTYEALHWRCRCVAGHSPPHAFLGEPPRQFASEAEEERAAKEAYAGMYPPSPAKEEVGDEGDE